MQHRHNLWVNHLLFPDRIYSEPDFIPSQMLKEQTPFRIMFEKIHIPYESGIGKIMEVLSKCIDAKELSFVECTHEKPYRHFIRNLVAPLRSMVWLEKISFVGCDLDDHGAEACKLLSVMSPYLRHVDMSNNPELTEATGEIFATLATNRAKMGRPFTVNLKGSPRAFIGWNYALNNNQDLKNFLSGAKGIKNVESHWETKGEKMSIQCKTETYSNFENLFKFSYTLGDETIDTTMILGTCHRLIVFKAFSPTDPDYLIVLNARGTFHAGRNLLSASFTEWINTTRIQNKKDLPGYERISSIFRQPMKMKKIYLDSVIQGICEGLFNGEDYTVAIEPVPLNATGFEHFYVVYGISTQDIISPATRASSKLAACFEKIPTATERVLTRHMAKKIKQG